MITEKDMKSQKRIKHVAREMWPALTCELQKRHDSDPNVVLGYCCQLSLRDLKTGEIVYVIGCRTWDDVVEFLHTTQASAREVSPHHRDSEVSTW